MKISLTLIFSFILINVFSQTEKTNEPPRLPNILDGNILLYKSDTLIVSYYWEKPVFEIEPNTVCYPRLADEYYFYQYQLVLCVKNLIKDTLYFKCKFMTYEAKPIEFCTEVEDRKGEQKYGFEFICPKSEYNYNGMYANNGDIVDFNFREFIVKFKLGKSKILTKEINETKQLTYRKLMHISK